MRTRYESVFEESARHFQLWLLVRRLNPESYRYIGMPNYRPKPIDCKAKTATRDMAMRKLAGLVADPTKPGLEGAFKNPAKAKASWKDFKPMLARPGAGYTMQDDAKSQHFGCVMLNGKYLHGDFDLLAIIDPANPANVEGVMEEIRGTVHIRCHRWPEVQAYLNGRLGAEMIQHGSQDLALGVDDEPIDAFGPDGEVCTILNGYSVRKWYEDRFAGRPAIGNPAFLKKT